MFSFKKNNKHLSKINNFGKKDQRNYKNKILNFKTQADIKVNMNLK